MNAAALKNRTKKFALRIIKVAGTLPNNVTGQVVQKQIIRSSTSVGANYRAACRAKSTADMINKLKIVEEEADETLYWLEIIGEAGLLPTSTLADLMRENNELIAIFVSSIKTLRQRKT